MRATSRARSPEGPWPQQGRESDPDMERSPYRRSRHILPGAVALAIPWCPEGCVEETPTSPHNSDATSSMHDGAAYRAAGGHASVASATHATNAPPSSTNNKQLQARYKATTHLLRRYVRKHTQMYEYQLADEVLKHKGTSRMYAASKLIAKRQAYNKLRMQLADGSRTDQPETTLPAVQTHYQHFFTTKFADPDPTFEYIDMFHGPPRQLQEPITDTGVYTAMHALKNGRASGPSTITGEGLKYGGKHIITAYRVVFNSIFENHTKMDSLHHAHLIVLNKPGKEPIPSNTRPITLLNIERKLLELILLAHRQFIV